VSGRLIRCGVFRAITQAFVLGWLLMGGTSTSWLSWSGLLVRPFRGLERGLGCGGLVRCWVLRERAIVSVVSEPV